MAYQRKTCRDCGGRNEVIDGLCGDCERNYVYCTVCNEHLGDDEAYYRHRHLWINEHGECLGPGGLDMTPEYTEEIKQSLFAVLDKTQIAEPLARSIQHNDMGFETIHFYGSMFGWDGLFVSLLGEPDSRYTLGYAPLFCGDRFTEGLTAEQEEAMADGVHWLIGLSNEKTPEANALTLEWIKEWQSRAA